MAAIFDFVPEFLTLTPYERFLVERGWPSPRGLLMGLGALDLLLSICACA